MDTLDELAEDFIVDGKETQPNVVNQNIADSTGEEHWGHLTTVDTKLNVLFSFAQSTCKKKVMFLVVL